MGVYDSRNTKWTTYSPTVLGLGTITSSVFQWRRVGGALEIIGYLVTGTPTGVLAQVSLPNSAVIDSAIPVNSFVGTAGYGGNGVGYFSVIGAGGNSFVNFGIQGSGLASLSPENGNAFLGSTTAFSFTTVSIPIAGWS